MVLFFSGTLLVSIIGLSSVLYIKHWELSTGQLFLGTVRPRADRFFHTIIYWIEHVLPTTARLWSRLLWRALLSLAHRAVAWLWLKAEQLLERVLHALRHTAPSSLSQASPFLREVAEHKKKLSATYLQNE